MNKMTAAERSLIADYLKEYENYCFQKTEKKQYLTENLIRAEKLYALCPEQPVYHLMCAAMLIYAGKADEGEEILKKYERNHVLQFKNQDFRAYFLYLAGVLTEDKLQKKNIVLQLQKLYQKNPQQPSLYWFLIRLDEGFAKNPEKKLAFLEKQWRLGCRQNLLYIEALRTLREYPAQAHDMDRFLMQNYIWAQRRHLLTKELAAQIAQNGMRLKSCDARFEYLLRETFRAFSTKELLAALCSLYIRAGRTDDTAAQYYAKGVEYELNLTNLYEYYMIAMAEQEKKLLPEQVLYHFLYHDSLSASQKAFFYKNIVRYGKSKPEIYEKYKEKIEKYTVESLLAGKISPEYAYLYEQMLDPRIFTKEMAEAMAELMFLRKLTCEEPGIREVEVSYAQLKQKKRVALKKQQAYVPIYSPEAVITLIDGQGNQYRNTVSYQLEKLFDEKRYTKSCMEHLIAKPGFLLYLCGNHPESREINEKTEKLYMQIPETRGFTEEYRNGILLRLFEYAQEEDRLLELPESWFLTDNEAFTREQRGKMTEFLIFRKLYREAFDRIVRYGTAFISSNRILPMISALADEKEAETETYYRLCYGCFKSGRMNFKTLKYLAASFLGTCRQMTEVWKKAKAYGVNTYELEERILVQMMFTGTELPEHFEIYLSYHQRGPEETVQKAYLTYLSREAFVKEKQFDSRFYFLLEEELQNRQGYAQICTLAYLKYLSGRQELSVKQKKLSAVYLKEFFSRRCYFGFMQDFGKTVAEALLLEDKVFVEYHAPSASSVTLHYAIEKKDKAGSRYTACRLYPLCSGVYSKAFSMFEGERITYFFTEERADGTKISTAPATVEKENSFPDSGTRYGRINAMRALKEKQDFHELEEEAEQYGFLETAAEELFPLE